MLLAKGQNTDTGATIIRSSEYEVMIAANSIESKKSKWPELSPATYGMGWGQMSARGHNVRVSHRQILRAYAHRDFR